MKKFFVIIFLFSFGYFLIANVSAQGTFLCTCSTIDPITGACGSLDLDPAGNRCDPSFKSDVGICYSDSSCTSLTSVGQQCLETCVPDTTPPTHNVGLGGDCEAAGAADPTAVCTDARSSCRADSAGNFRCLLAPRSQADGSACSDSSECTGTGATCTSSVCANPVVSGGGAAGGAPTTGEDEVETTTGVESCIREDATGFNETDEGCVRCINAGGIWTAIGCIDPTPIGIVTGLIRIALGVMGGVALVQLIIAGMYYQSGKEEKIEEAKGKIKQTIGGVALLVFSVLILRIIGVNVLDVVPEGIF